MERTLATLMLLAAAGCAQVPVETPEETAQRWSVSCLESGFAKDSDAYKVCLLLERQNDRMLELERRLRAIESQTMFIAPPLYRGRWYW